MAETAITYVGEELEVFALAHNYKAYLRHLLAPHLRGAVAEVGAGRGATTHALADLPGVQAWSAIEPDPDMLDLLRREAAADRFPAAVTVRGGTLADLGRDVRFDAVIYIDVLEHIEGDAEDLVEAARHLRPGGRIVVLSPAWPFLYSPFDAAIGHFRRYTRASLRAVGPTGLRERDAFYVDCVGLLASCANKLVLKQSMPNRRQIETWDRLMIPVSRRVDPLIGRAIGRSIVLVWEAPDA